jgi:hypothetical protein
MTRAPMRFMIDLALLVLALMAGGVAYAFYAAARAPFGYEDEQGFHIEKSQPAATREASLAIAHESSR